MYLKLEWNKGKRRRLLELKRSVSLLFHQHQTIGSCADWHEVSFENFIHLHGALNYNSRGNSNSNIAEFALEFIRDTILTHLSETEILHRLIEAAYRRIV